MSCIKNICCLLLLSCCSDMLYAQKTRVTLAGNIGTSASFYSSNEPRYTRPAYAWTAYGNFTARINKLSLPFSFVVNQYDKSRVPAYVQAGVSPTYKWARLHIGDRYVQFSPLVFEGQSFRGIGLELNPRKFRFAAFYGKLNKAVDEDTALNNFRVPQYARTGYGVKIGYGNAARYIDLLYFHAKDDSSSASLSERGARKTLAARENAVLGVSGKIDVLNKLLLKLIVAGDFAISGLTRDLSFGKESTDSLTPRRVKMMSNFLTYNTSTVANYAGQLSLIFNTRGFNTNIGYRRVDPEFKSLGTPYMINDIELITWNNYISVAAGKLNINTGLSHQHNNLDKVLNTELRTFSGNIFVNALVGTKCNLSFGYSGYDFKNKDGVTAINDTILVNQRISQFNFNPGYNFTKGDKLHYINAGINVSILKDKNKFTSPQVNSNNISTSLGYTMAFVKRSFSVTINGLYSRYTQEDLSYNSYGLTGGGSVQLLKHKNLNMQGNVGYYYNRLDSGITQSNMTYVARVGYRMKKHSLTVSANYIFSPPNKINDLINRKIPYAVATKNVAGALTYNYNF